ncbi:MAG: hypothetical protein Q8M94_18425, partial [Ignavibacteria bacterium]|nr:hypothetical protein [Ignavibacteria bacterium]
MRYRLSEILAPEDLGAAGTKVIEINVNDVISRIDVIFRTKNPTSVFSDHPAANLSKIELVDGSDVLYSLTGREAQAMNFYDRGMAPDNHLTGSNGEWMKATFGLDFGRHLFDPVLAFNPTKISNPQLKLTWDEDVANTSCVENEMRVMAHLFDEFKPTPTGFLMSKNQYTYTPAANAYEYLDLPRDYPIRKILVGSHQEERTFTQMIAELRLNEDNDKRVPMDITGVELWYYIKQNFPELVENVYAILNTTATAFRVTPSEDAVIVGARTSTTGGFWILFQNGGLAKGLCVTTAETMYMICKGHIPHGLAVIPFGDQKDDAD